MAVHNKLHAIKPTIGGQSVTYRSRKEQVILDRLKIGHTRLTYSFLLKGNHPQSAQRVNVDELDSVKKFCILSENVIFHE